MTKPRRNKQTSDFGLLGVMAAVVALLAAGGAARAAEKEAPIDWPARAATVKVGMTRAEVEKILPKMKKTPGSKNPYETTTTTASWNRASYMVADGWRVIVTYDYSGAAKPAPPSTSQNWQDWINGENRVTAPVKVGRFTPPPGDDPKLYDANLIKKIDDIIKECSMITPGKTRADLLKIFTTEGGLSSAARRTYVHRRCFFIKVNVEFSIPDLKQRDVFDPFDTERPTDIITSISKPYLEWRHLD